jgi:hypothetical protein
VRGLKAQGQLNSTCTASHLEKLPAPGTHVRDLPLPCFLRRRARSLHYGHDEDAGLLEAAAKRRGGGEVPRHFIRVAVHNRHARRLPKALERKVALIAELIALDHRQLGLHSLPGGVQIGYMDGHSLLAVIS